MNQAVLKDLAILTLKEPALAARQVMALQLGREVMWTGLALAIVLSATLLSLQNILLPPDPSVPSLFRSPVVYLAAVGIGQVVFIYAVWLAGTWLDGKGSLDEVMSVLVWLQLLQVVVQALLVLLAIAAPALAVLLHMAAIVYGLFILLHFVNEAHSLNSLIRAAGVVFAAVFAIAFSLSLVLALAGGSQMGLSNV